MAGCHLWYKDWEYPIQPIDPIQRGESGSKPRWHPADRLLLRAAWSRGVSIPDMARQLGRTVEAIWGKAQREGLPCRKRHPANVRSGPGDEGGWEFRRLHPCARPTVGLSDITGDVTPLS